MRHFPGVRATLFGCVAFGMALAAAVPTSAQTSRRGASARPAADVGRFEERVFRDAAGAHKYVVYLPAGYSAAKKWPVILYLHGASETGNDGRLPTTVGIGRFLLNWSKPKDGKAPARAPAPFVVVFPQSELTEARILTRWRAGEPDGDRALAILDEVEKTYSIDTKRRILTGWSMGGWGAWALAAAHPEMWSAVVPLAGGGDPAWAERLKDVPIWAVHGALDRAVAIADARAMVEAVRAAGGTVHFTELPNGDHEEPWMWAYGSEQTYRWMLQPRDDGTRPPETVTAAGLAPAEAGEAPFEIPFVPAVQIPGATYVRLGNDALKDLADSVPFVVPADVLSGGLGDIYDGTSFRNIDFSVRFYSISYASRISRAWIQAYAKDRLNVQVALQNIHVRIGGTAIRGEGGRSASTGPISIVIGHRYPIWLSVDVRPYVDKGRVRFQLLATRFAIPSDNWYVSGPAGVSARGWGMTEERVASNVVSGLYGSRYRIEAEVRGTVPSLIAEMERRFDVNQFDGMALGIWPIPGYQPRLRLAPQEISTDKDGVTLVMGVTAADYSNSPRTLRVAAPAGLRADAFAGSKRLEAGLAPAMLTPLSQMLIDNGLARVHLGDVPVKEFGPLLEANGLAEIFPDLKRHGDVEVWSELRLTKPLRAENDAESLAFGVEGLELVFKFRPPGAEWRNLGHARINFRQPVAADIVRPSSRARAITMQWAKIEDVELKADWAEGYEPADATIDADRLKTVFLAGWNAWSFMGPPQRTLVPDLDLGYCKLRLEEVQRDGDRLGVAFKRAGVILTNSSGAELEYQTKGPYSGWSESFVLKPGASATFEIAYPLLFRSQIGGQTRTYTLPAGSHSEFRVPKDGGPPQLFQFRD